MKTLLLAALLVTGLGCSSSTDSGSGSRIGNKNTKVFHTTSCRYASGLTNPITFSAREDAIAAGYTADQSGACNP
jgi:hypothetical protein